MIRKDIVGEYDELFAYIRGNDKMILKGKLLKDNINFKDSISNNVLIFEKTYNTFVCESILFLYITNEKTDFSKTLTVTVTANDEVIDQIDYNIPQSKQTLKSNRKIKIYDNVDSIKIYMSSNPEGTYDINYQSSFLLTYINIP